MHLSELNPDPIEQFKLWYSEAKKKEDEADACCLATVDKYAKPSARMLLFKGVSNRGFLLVTNYYSKKAKDVEINPAVALTFYWHRCYQQVRIEGTLQKTLRAESETYFKTRSHESQISAWASPQSDVIPDREFLIKRVEETNNKFEKGEIRCPSFWGGYRLVPNMIEFWQGGEHRLHDRFSYRIADGKWKIERLAP